MAAGSLAAGAAGTGMSFMGQRKAGEAAMREAYYNAEMADMQAEDIKRKAADDANEILTQAANVRSSQQAHTAASGFVVGDGSAQTVLDETTRLSTADALVVLYDGIDGYTTTTANARNTRAAGVNAASAANTAATGTLLSGTGSLLGSAASSPSIKSAYSKLTTTK